MIRRALAVSCADCLAVYVNDYFVNGAFFEGIKKGRSLMRPWG